MLARFVSRAVFAVIAAAVAVGTVLVFAQAPFAPARFDYGVERTFEGTIARSPYPVLFTGSERYLLVGPGKHGAGTDLVGSVRIVGSVIEHGGDRALEVLRATTRSHAGARTDDQVIGPIVLTGEVVDTKCYFGVMNPGSGKVHRDCAVRCISGGVPPGLLVRDRDGMLHTVLLAAADGRELHREVLGYVAQPVRVHGTLVRTAGSLVLRADAWE
jgi:hypothetical protein